MAEIEFNRQARIHIYEAKQRTDIPPEDLIHYTMSVNTTIGVQYPYNKQELNGYDGIKSIVSGSMQLTKTLSDSNIQYGALIASEFSCQLYYKPVLDYPTEYLPFVISKGNVIEVTVGDYDAETDTFSNAIFFSGYIDVCSRDVDNENYYTITAYDWSYYNRNKDISDKWNTLIDYIHEYSVVAIPVWRLLTLTTKLLFTNDYSDIMVTNYTDFADLNIYVDLDATKLPYVDNLSIEDYLRWVGELLGVCFEPYTLGLELQEEDATRFIYPKSQIRVVRINESQEAISLVNNIEKHNSSTESYVTENVSGVQVYNGSDLLYATGTDDNPYKIYDNPFFGYLVEPQDFVADLLTRIDEVTFTPCNLKLIVSNPGIQLGDKITYELGKTYHSRVLQMIYSGTLFVDEQIICNALGEKLQQENTTQYSGTDTSAIEAQIQELIDETVKVDPPLKTMSDEALQTQDGEQILARVRNNITDILAPYVQTSQLNAVVSDLLEYIREKDGELSDRINACVTSTELTNTLTSYLLKSDFDSTIKHYIWSAYMQYDNPSNFIVLRTVDTTLYQNDEIVRVSFAKNMGVVHMSIVLKVYAPIPSYNATTGEGKIFGINDFASMQYQIDRLTAQYAFDTMGSVGANQTAGARSFYFRPSDENDTTQGDIENVSYVINTYDAITPPSGSFTYIRLSATWLVLDEEE